MEKALPLTLTEIYEEILDEIDFPKDREARDNFLFTLRGQLIQ